MFFDSFRPQATKPATKSRSKQIHFNLIALSSERGTASADDLLPVLVFVLLQANPPNLLSTIQYIGDFYSARMQGQVAYWWTQFAASVEFLKQLLNRVLL
uniref:VPS9 domain-containing protein n=1 Tax=Ditylenchus dipsaci TaxID=166011 RepID=A0A915DND8_9BILA